MRLSSHLLLLVHAATGTTPQAYTELQIGTDTLLDCRFNWVSTSCPRRRRPSTKSSSLSTKSHLLIIRHGDRYARDRCAWPLNLQESLDIQRRRSFVGWFNTLQKAVASVRSSVSFVGLGGLLLITLFDNQAVLLPYEDRLPGGILSVFCFLLNREDPGQRLGVPDNPNRSRPDK